jgi:hypothetical protein
VGTHQNFVNENKNEVDVSEISLAYQSVPAFQMHWVEVEVGVVKIYLQGVLYVKTILRSTSRAQLKGDYHAIQPRTYNIRQRQANNQQSTNIVILNVPIKGPEATMRASVKHMITENRKTQTKSDILHVFRRQHGEE